MDKKETSEARKERNLLVKARITDGHFYCSLIKIQKTAALDMQNRDEIY